MGRERQRLNKKLFAGVRKQSDSRNCRAASDNTMSEESEPGLSSGIDLDSVTLSKLQLEVTAPTVWGQPKPQPALLSVTLVLRSGFRSAANKDELDENTINYGDLAKRIRAECDDKPTLDVLFLSVEALISSMAMRGNGTCRLQRSVLVVNLPQASMYGESCELVDIVQHDNDGKTTLEGCIFALKQVKVMLLIGLKKEERLQKQPVVIDLDVNVGAEEEYDAEKKVGSNIGLLGIEQKLVEIIQDTTFGTLEALADFTAEKLEDHFINANLPCTRLYLSFSKRRVIDFAEGPKVDVVRNLRKKHSAGNGGVAVANGRETGNLPSQLKILKPYV